jgi:acyl carrier protein
MIISCDSSSKRGGIDIKETVLRVVERETGRAATLETPLDELGLDSLDFLDLTLAIGAETGRPLSHTRLQEIETVGDLVRAIQ